MTISKGLSTYLKDHFAGAAGGSELAGRVSAEYSDGPVGAFLAELARDIEADKDALQELMGRLDVAPDPLKAAAGWVAEKASRFKLSETLTGDADLKRLMEFEVLSLGIGGKLALWRSLSAIADTEPGLAGVDLAGLAERAEHQRASLEEHRLAAARAALTN